MNPYNARRDCARRGPTRARHGPTDPAAAPDRQVSRAYVALGLAAALLLGGCSRAYYRRQADAEAYWLIDGSAAYTPDPDQIYRINVDARSRMFDAASPDYPPMPEDDPESHRLMHRVDGKHGYKLWDRNGFTRMVDNPDWLSYLPADAAGVVVLDADAAVRAALLNSIRYQQELENLYLSALDVSFERFRFDTQFFGGYSSDYRADGRARFGPAGPSQSILTLSTFPGTRGIRAEKLLANGGELVVGLANSLVWQFSGRDTHTATTLLDFALVQPLLRGAGRDQVLERLTITERALLSNVRIMERFRRGFYTNIVTGRDAGGGPSRRGGVFGGSGLEGFSGVGSGGFGRITGAGAGGGVTGGAGAAQAGGFIGLLQDRQEIRNQESNIAALRNSLAQLEAFFHAGRIDFYQVELARQALYNAQSRLLNSRTAYQSSLDAFKLTLGMPPQIEIRIEDPMADQFNLLDTAIVAVQDRVTTMQAEIGQAIINTLPEAGQDELNWSGSLAGQLRRLKGHLDEMEQLRVQLATVDMVRALDDVARLRTAVSRRIEDRERLRLQLEAARQTATGDTDIAGREIEIDMIDVEKLQQLPERLDETLAHLAERFKTREQTLAGYHAAIDRLIEDGPALDGAELRQRLADDVTTPIPGELSELSTDVLELLLTQARARTESVVLMPIDIDAPTTLRIARCNRRDWMNARAALVDAWRLVQFNAKDLESDLDVTFSGDVGNTGDNPFRLSDTTGRLRVGLQFDAPLTRLEERNNYRQSLIEYQQARRSYYRFQDNVARGLRDTLRVVRLNQLNFELRRRAVQVAIGQVELAQLRLQEPPKPNESEMFGATTARDLVNALSDLLNVQNDFLSVWANYEVRRRSLDLDMGTMQLDTEGIWVDPGAIGPDFHATDDCPDLESTNENKNENGGEAHLAIGGEPELPEDEPIPPATDESVAPESVAPESVAVDSKDDAALNPLRTPPDAPRIAQGPVLNGASDVGSAGGDEDSGGMTPSRDGSAGVRVASSGMAAEPDPATAATAATTTTAAAMRRRLRR